MPCFQLFELQMSQIRLVDIRCHFFEKTFLYVFLLSHFRNPIKAYQLWGELCGAQSINTATIATTKDAATPDIITVTDCLATLSKAEYLSELDEVFSEAVQRGIVLRGNKLDLQWEIDLSGMSFAVARAACRHVVKRTLEQTNKDDCSVDEELSFITGVGKAHLQRGKSNQKSETLDKNPTKSLREYIQHVLQTDFNPPLETTIPQRAQGMVVVKKSSLIKWIKTQKNSNKTL